MEIPLPEEPLISIILPIKNSAETLFPCLQSLLFQNYHHIEVIAVDDCSRDNSLQILREFQKTDSRVRIIKNVKTYGRAISINRALKKARGKLIVFMEPTDMITAQKLSKQVAELRKDKHVVAANSQCMTMNHLGKRVGKSHYPLLASEAMHLPYRQNVLFSGIMINRYRIPKDLLDCEADEPALFAAQLISRLLTYGEIVTIPEYLHTHMAQHLTGHLMHKFTKSIRVWLEAKVNHQQAPSLTAVFANVMSPAL